MAAGNAGVGGQTPERRQIGDRHGRVRDRLQVQERRPGQRGPHGLEVVGIDEVGPHPEPRQHLREQVERAAVELEPATIRSPERTMEVTTVWMAAMPLAKPKAASVPSSPAICASKASTVGLPYPRVYVKPARRNAIVSA